MFDKYLLQKLIKLINLIKTDIYTKSPEEYKYYYGIYILVSHQYNKNNNTHYDKNLTTTIINKIFCVIIMSKYSKIEKSCKVTNKNSCGKTEKCYNNMTPQNSDFKLSNSISAVTLPEKSCLALGSTKLFCNNNIKPANCKLGKDAKTLQSLIFGSKDSVNIIKN